MSSSSSTARECGDGSLRWSMARNNVRRRRRSVDNADVAHLARRFRRVCAHHVLDSETNSEVQQRDGARRDARSHRSSAANARVITATRESYASTHSSQSAKAGVTDGHTGHRQDTHNDNDNDRSVENPRSICILARRPSGEAVDASARS